MHTFSFHARRTARSFGLVTVGVLSTLGALSLSHVGPVQAQSPGVNLAQLVAQVNTLQSNLTAETTRAEKAEAALQTRTTALEAKTAPLSLSSDPNIGGTNTLLTIKGVNVQIVDGNSSGLTDDGTQGEVNNAKLTGLGNLIIGYNAAGNDQGKGDVRIGSHNLILGDYNNYGSFGGLVAGYDSTLSGPYASVSGGGANTASGEFSSVSGGVGNTASGELSSVSGGESNTASGFIASVSGGAGNTASREISSVSGGESNMAAGGAATVSGGTAVTQSTDYGWSGGSYHTP